MKKMLITAALLCLSLSTFANDSATTETIQALQVGEIFSEFLPTKTRVGICEIKKSQFDEKNEYIIAVKEGNGLIGEYHNVTYSVKTPSKIDYENNSFMITNSYKFKESGVSVRRILQMKARKSDSGKIKIFGIFIETRVTNSLGKEVLDMQQSVHCLNRF